MEPMRLPGFWEEILKRYLKKTFYAGTRKEDFAEREGFTEGDYRFFARGVEKLNRAFTQERHSLPRNYFNQKELRSGYLLYFLPVNALKVSALLRQNILTPESRPYTILDIGCGPGTGLFAVFHWFDSFLRSRPETTISLQWVLVDQNSQVLQDAREFHGMLLENLKRKHPGSNITSSLKLITMNLFNEHLARCLPSGETYDLILSLNSLSELPQGKRVSIVESLLRKYLKPTGRILVMEPALRITTRDLMHLHDELVERKSAAVLAPCLHQSSCPMLAANHRDWCHTYIPWERPPWIEKIDRLVGIRKDYLKCAYLLLGREAPVVSRDLWRVVSGPLNSKGKSERLLCGPGGLPNLLRIMRLDRDRSPANQDFDCLERGDRVQLESTNRVVKETSIKQIRT